jgi:segregation and condensation protein A
MSNSELSGSSQTPSPAAADHAVGAGVQPATQPDIPFATIRGEAVTHLPEDLYIPPDALEVILEAFTGPLDLLLYLIRRQNLDILDIPIASITRQYVEYIQLMRDMRLELAAEYLVMAAILAEIKSRMLLPRPHSDDDSEEEDPRAELIRRLQQYERFKQAAEDLDHLPQVDRDVYLSHVDASDMKPQQSLPQLDMRELLLALAEVTRRADLFSHHRIQGEALSVRERMGNILELLRDNRQHRFESLFTVSEGRRGVVVSFMALLELLKEHLIDVLQQAPGQQIYLRAANQEQAQGSA